MTLNRPCQGQCPGLALLLLVLGILADHHDLALAADDLALLADGLHGRTNLHALLPPVVESERVRRMPPRILHTLGPITVQQLLYTRCAKPSR